MFAVSGGDRALEMLPLCLDLDQFPVFRYTWEQMRPHQVTGLLGTRD